MKNRLKFLAVMMVVLLAFLTACGGKSSESSGSASNSPENTNNSATSDADKEKPLKVALVTSAGGLGDKSYNDSGYEGLKKVELVLGMETKVVEPKDISEGEKLFDRAGKSGLRPGDHA